MQHEFHDLRCALFHYAAQLYMLPLPAMRGDQLYTYTAGITVLCTYCSHLNMNVKPDILQVYTVFPRLNASLE